MTAIACLRIAVGQDLRFTDDAGMAEIVAKFAEDFLSAHWTWPRRFSLVSPFVFVLADSRAERFDASELQALARGLKQKLFGESGDGDVCLLMLEGSQFEVSRFASAPLSELQSFVQGRDNGAYQARICRVTPAVVESIAPPDGPVTGVPATDGLDAGELGARTTPGWWGVYYLPTGTFVGGAVTLRSLDVEARAVKPSGLEYEILCLRAAWAAIAAGDKGVVYLPIDYSTIIKPATRNALRAEFARAPRGQRPRLAASILNVPRAPSLSALTKIREFLEPHVSFIDLKVSDPLFRIADAPPGVANSVTLALEGADGRARVAAIRTFLGEQAAYKAKQVWQGVDDVASAAELSACRSMMAACLSGPMISSLLTGPIMDVAHAAEALPYRWSEAFRLAIVGGRSRPPG